MTRYNLQILYNYILQKYVQIQQVLKISGSLIKVDYILYTCVYTEIKMKDTSETSFITKRQVNKTYDLILHHVHLFTNRSIFYKIKTTKSLMCYVSPLHAFVFYLIKYLQLNIVRTSMY